MESRNAWVSRCVYLDGIHVYAGKDCDHYEFQREADENGEVHDPGWTVQQS